MIRDEDWSGDRIATPLRLAFVIALTSACSRASKPTAPGCCEKSGPGWTEDAGPVAAAPVASAPPKPPARFRSEEGCARDFKSSGDSAQDLGELERLCAQGLKPLLSPSDTTRPIASDAVEIPFRVAAATACLRGGALGVAPRQVLSLENARGVVLASAVSTEAIAVVPVDGTVCVREPGAYRLVIKPAPGSSEARTLTVQVWQASRE